ncbi:uncharacterized protein [Symphalangus syndactylus]|uniref:uncharacterized protein n=1 Tax=Symphalangus syndactylus TaxID=9590 RepID=UPI003005DC56
MGGRAEALLTSQTVGGRPGRGAPHFPDRAAGRAEALLTSQTMGGRAEALLTSQTMGGRAEALLASSRTGRPGRGAPRFRDGAAGQRRSSLPRRWVAGQRRSSLPRRGGRAEALLTSQTGWPGRGAPHFPDDGWPGRDAPHLPDGAAAGQGLQSQHPGRPRQAAGRRRLPRGQTTPPHSSPGNTEHRVSETPSAVPAPREAEADRALGVRSWRPAWRRWRTRAAQPKEKKQAAVARAGSPRKSAAMS